MGGKLRFLRGKGKGWHREVKRGGEKGERGLFVTTEEAMQGTAWGDLKGGGKGKKPSSTSISRSRKCLLRRREKKEQISGSNVFLSDLRRIGRGIAAFPREKKGKKKKELAQEKKQYFFRAEAGGKGEGQEGGPACLGHRKKKVTATEGGKRGGVGNIAKGIFHFFFFFISNGARNPREKGKF